MMTLLLAVWTRLYMWLRVEIILIKNGKKKVTTKMKANEITQRQINALLYNTFNSLPHYIDKEDLYQIAHITYWEISQKGRDTAFVMSAIRHKWLDYVEKEINWHKRQIGRKPLPEQTIAADVDTLSLFDELIQNADEETRQIVNLKWNRMSVSEIALSLGASKARVYRKLRLFVKKSRKRVDRARRCGII